MPHLSFILKQLVDCSDIYTLRIPPKLTCDDMHKIEAAGGKSDGTDVSITNRDSSKHVLEYYSRYDTECPLMVRYPKNSYVECEGSAYHIPLNKIRADHSHTHPGYCQLLYFNGQDDMRRGGHTNFKEPSALAHRAFEGYRCSIWPFCAAEWITRKTKTDWPPAEIKKKIKAEGCLVIWRPHPKSKEPQFEWQFLFANAEKVLFRDMLSRHQRYIFDVFKISVDYQSKHLNIKLHTVHVKSVFFYACEEIQDSKFEESPGGCFLFVIGLLLECLRKRNIPNYFTHENNMIDHMEEDDVKKLIDVVETLRIFPLQSLTFLIGSKGYKKSWLTDVVSMDVCAFQSDVNMNRLIHQLFFPTIIRYARKLADGEQFKQAYQKVEKARLLLVMAFSDKDGNRPDIPTLDYLLRETLESANEYTKGMMAQTVEEMSDMKLYTTDTALKKIKDYTGGVDVAGYGNRKMPIEFLGNPLLESAYLHDLGAEQYNRFHQDENASSMYQAAIDHLENELLESSDKRDREDDGPNVYSNYKGYEGMLILYYNSLIMAYRNMGNIHRMRTRLPKLEMLCKKHCFTKMAGIVMELWVEFGDSVRGVQFYTTISDSGKYLQWVSEENRPSH